MDCGATAGTGTDSECGDLVEPRANFSKESPINVNKVRRFFIPDYDPLDPQGLPEDWVLIRHDSGIMLYLHQPTRTATLSRPFQLSSGSIRLQRIPRFAIPCYDYRKRKCATSPELCLRDVVPIQSQVTSVPPTQSTDTTPNPPPVTDELLLAEPPIADTTDDDGDDDNDGGGNQCNTDGENETEKEEGELSSADEGEDDDAVENELTEETETDGGSSTEPPAKRPHLGHGKIQFNTIPEMHGNSKPKAGTKIAQPPLTTMPKDTASGDARNAIFLTSEDIREYLGRLFSIQEEDAIVFRNRGERIRYYRQKRESKKLAAAGGSGDTVGSNSEGGGCPVMHKAMDRVRAMFDKSPVCILHEYCQNILHQQVVFQPIVCDTDAPAFRFAAVVNGVTYAAGTGTNKKAARSEAAKMALCEILPDYKEMLEESRITSTDHQDSSTPSSMPNAAGAPASSNALPTDAELEVFKRLGMVDKKIYELTNTSRLTCVSPYSIFSEYVRRHCIPEREINAKMVPLGRNRHRFELSLGDLHSKVLCKNKRIGRHHAAQELLAMLHPQLETWADLLALYGPNSKPDKKCDNGAIQDAQTRGPNAVKTSLIRLLKAKMLELSEQWEIKENASRKGKFNVSPYNLPVVQPHSDASTNMYSSTSIEEEINSTEHLDYPG